MDRRTMIKQSLLGGAGMLMMPQLLQAMIKNGDLKKSDFGNDFKWGAATAAYQIEGAHNIDGKGPSIWDTFTSKPKNIHNGDNGNVSCDFYHNYRNDLQLLSDLNFDVFRFSTAWSRIIPEGIGKPNQKGLDFYHRVIDECLGLGIEPWVTLYHWDLPQALQDKGGWTNRDVVNWFYEYADLVTREYGDKVKDWMVLNEPMAFTALGYMLGIHAPGEKGLKKFLKSTHHATLCQAEGGRIIRANVSGANIGSTFSCSHVDPKSDKEKHIKAAKKMDVLFNRLFLEPALGLGYPMQDLKLLERLEKFMEPGDEEKLAFDFDFIGLQNYTRMVARHSLWPPVLWANQVKPEKRIEDESELTEMKWEVYPEGIYKVLKQFWAYDNVKRIIVTENGAAFPDEVENGRVHDQRRKQFFKDYLKYVLKAMEEGVNIDGYFVWTFLDNFEWAEGYDPRFGIVHVDFETQQRTVKDSGRWWKDFLEE